MHRLINTLIRSHSSSGSILTLAILFFLCSCNQINAGTRYLSKANQFVSTQNVVRSGLGLAPLVWDYRLAAYAQWYAEERRWDCDLRHSNGPYGENLFWGGGSGWTPAQAVASWVSERESYDHSTNTCSLGEGECGHYTQIIWGPTKRVGCAAVNCYDGLGVFMICSYDPPGNYMGEKPY